ncbi:hypothetical protein M5689_006889 [Euphorbia peplus]|nr:hypothetical protein M5689_006889 [Euphorbia peplus]
MDLFDFDAMKMKNTCSISWLNHLPTLTKLFRWTEFCLALVLLSWIFNRLPFLLRISGDFFRQFAGVIACPLFVFLLCNAIIVTLILNSQRFSAENPAADSADTQLYDQLVQNNKNSPSKPFPSENIEFEDKEIIISQVKNAVSDAVEDDDSFIVTEKSSVSDTPRVFRRWKSERVELTEKETVKLRRSETEKFMNRGGNDGVLCVGEDEKQSDEEFQRKVDDFIAKHLMFRRQECADVVQPTFPGQGYEYGV